MTSSKITESATLRDRFGIAPKNSAIVSRVIKDTLDENLVKPVEDNMSRKYRRYVPIWA